MTEPGTAHAAPSDEGTPDIREWLHHGVQQYRQYSNKDWEKNGRFGTFTQFSKAYAEKHGLNRRSAFSQFTAVRFLHECASAVLGYDEGAALQSLNPDAIDKVVPAHITAYSLELLERCSRVLEPSEFEVLFWDVWLGRMRVGRLRTLWSELSPRLAAKYPGYGRRASSLEVEERRHDDRVVFAHRIFGNLLVRDHLDKLGIPESAGVRLAIFPTPVNNLDGLLAVFGENRLLAQWGLVGHRNWSGQESLDIRLKGEFWSDLPVLHVLESQVQPAGNVLWPEECPSPHGFAVFSEGSLIGASRPQQRERTIDEEDHPDRFLLAYLTEIVRPHG